MELKIGCFFFSFRWETKCSQQYFYFAVQLHGKHLYCN